MPAGTYTFSTTVTSDDTAYTTNLIYFFNTVENKGVVSKIINRNTRDSITVDVPSPFDSIYLYASIGLVESDGKTATFSDIQLELGSTPTDYEPYQPGTIAALALPETIYGGTVDAVTGEVQSTYAVLRAEDFTTWGIVDFPNVRTYRSTALPDDADDRDAKLPVLCDKLAPSDEVTFAAQEPGSIYRLGRVLSVAVEKDEAPEETAARYGAISVAYTLKTPRAFIATGAQPVFALPGKNTLLTDGDSLTVSGRSDPTAYIQQQISDAITAAVAITGGT